jgi:hypothetical protein
MLSVFRVPRPHGGWGAPPGAQTRSARSAWQPRPYIESMERTERVPRLAHSGRQSLETSQRHRIGEYRSRAIARVRRSIALLFRYAVRSVLGRLSALRLHRGRRSDDLVALPCTSVSFSIKRSSVGVWRPRPRRSRPQLRREDVFLNPQFHRPDQGKRRGAGVRIRPENMISPYPVAKAVLAEPALIVAGRLEPTGRSVSTEKRRRRPTAPAPSQRGTPIRGAIACFASDAAWGIAGLGAFVAVLVMSS